MKKLISLLISVLLINPQHSYSSPLRQNSTRINSLSLNDSNLNIVSDIPFSQVRPLDSVHLEAITDEPGSYVYRFSAKVDGVFKQLRGTEHSNSYVYNVPSNFEKIELLVEAININNAEVIKKTALIKYYSSLVLNKTKLYQKEKLTISHPLINSGPLYGCNGEAGTYHINPTGSAGGYVSSYANVSNEAFVSVDSEVCGDSKIIGKVSVDSSKVQSSTLIGNNTPEEEGVLISNSMVNDSFISGGWVRVSHNSRLNDSSIKGNYVHVKTTSLYSSDVLSDVNTLWHYGLFDSSTINNAKITMFEVPGQNFNSSMSIIQSIINSNISGYLIWVLSSTINNPLSGNCFKLINNNRQDSCKQFEEGNTYNQAVKIMYQLNRIH